jgi:small subunit ribosomal protein S9
MTEEDKTERNPQPEDAEVADDNSAEVPERATEAGTTPEDRIEPEGDSGPEQSSKQDDAAPAVGAEGESAEEGASSAHAPSPEAAEGGAEALPDQPGEQDQSAPELSEAGEEPEPAAEPTISEPAPTREKKADLIPGAHLEPIVVEPEAAPLSAEERARLEAEAEERARREAELVGGAEEPDTASRAPAQMESGARYLATGKRKSAIARVTLSPGEGKFEVNRRALDEFFPRPLHQTMALQALVASGYEGNVDVRVLVHGGGISGQAGAVRHGIARALTEIDPELRGDLKRRGFLTRDARVKERRKAGLKKARKRPQFSKR